MSEKDEAIKISQQKIWVSKQNLFNTMSRPGNLFHLESPYNVLKIEFFFFQNSQCWKYIMQEEFSEIHHTFVCRVSIFQKNSHFVQKYHN